MSFFATSPIHTINMGYGYEMTRDNSWMTTCRINLLKQTRLKKKTEFNEEQAKLKKELEMCRQKNIALEEELKIVREHQLASDNLNQELQSQDKDLISKSEIRKKLEIFTCSICHELLIKPVVTNCNHSFCEKCLDTWRTTSKKEECPICRAIVRNVHMTPEIDEYITSMVGCLSSEAFAERLQIIEDRNSSPVKKRKVSSQQDLERYERDDLLNIPPPSFPYLPVNGLFPNVRLISENFERLYAYGRE